MRCHGSGAWLAIVLLATAGLADAAIPESGDTDRFVRLELERGRGLSAEGRHEAAERAYRRGLEARPEDPTLLRALAGALEAQGRDDEARAARAHAEALSPTPVLPGDPLHGSRGALVLLVPPPESAAAALRAAWPEGPVGRTLEGRLAARLPEAAVAHADPESVAAAQRWLGRQGSRAAVSLQPTRLHCGFSVKDGSVGIATLRVASAVPAAAPAAPVAVRAVVEDPQSAEGCAWESVARALEEALALPEVAGVLASPAASPPSPWSGEAVRALFPGLTRRIEAQLVAGRARLAAGQLVAAHAAFERAARIDPEDPGVVAYLRETEAALAMSRELGDDAEPDATDLDLRLDAKRRAAAERALEDEQRRRETLLAALAVLDEDAELPPPALLQQLRPFEIREPEAFGPRLARDRTGGEIRARAAFAPDGSVLAVYYFGAGDDGPAVREEDTSGDGRADRWITYRGSARHEIYEKGGAPGRPDLHFVFAPGGTPLERVEIDAQGDGQVDRVFLYTGGALVAERRDTDGDGRLDQYDRFDGEGLVGLREQDLDGDGEIDVRSHYEGGKLVRREISDPELPES